MASPVETLPFVSTLLLLLVLIACAPSEAANSMALPGCQATCGGVDVPYPFGIGGKCFRDGFEIMCNNGTTPVLAGTDYQVLNLSVAPSVARVRLPIAWKCYNASGSINSTDAQVAFNPQGVYRISDERNELVVIGCNTVAWIKSKQATAKNSPYAYDIYTGCVSYCTSAESTVEGRCAGVGCCKVDFPAGLTDNAIAFGGYEHTDFYQFSPCSYSFLVDRDSYTFRQADLYMDKDRMMPVWLDWAIRPPNGSLTLTCSDAKKDGASYACKGPNTNCTNAVNGPGYSCQCADGYEGNPYIDGDGGCTNINECTNPDRYKCYGHCRDTEGSFECSCPRGSHGKPKEAPCDPNFPRVAQIVIGVICGIALITVSAIFLVMVHQRRKLREFFKRNGGPLLANINNIKIFTKEELNQITKNYSIVLGKGGFGQVYMGTIDSKQQVAVKRSISVEEARKKEFANEVIIQSRISHRNIVRLLGCCLEVDVPMLVYEFAPKGSLNDVLHGTKDITKASLSLGTRLDIAVDSAEALSYMHSSTNQKILHGDVKSGNILLDENFMPKVSDFGTSRLLSIEKKHTMLVIGDMNYIDPVYMKTGCLDEKSDVYSFGVVLLELITRKKPRYDGNNSLIINFIKSYASEDKAREMFDEEITSPENIEFLQKVGSVAVVCLKEDMDDRPTMKQVAEHLQLVRREWKQRQGGHGDQVADVISMESPPVSLTMDATGAETPGYSPLLK
ncbi:Wall-associated receptor kinase 2 [Dichanthelium oligosanthes]|uniref:Wall-associated receptor kinase 2 n=1 Tax=Dichanthelium oligosanthes TaxID=888268 RepID=A0A1E5VQ63_9POAL|nr:Wall-associated receptor kinase 2 [Dichanthelium oligosanthes]